MIAPHGAVRRVAADAGHAAGAPEPHAVDRKLARASRAPRCADARAAASALRSRAGASARRHRLPAESARCCGRRLRWSVSSGFAPLHARAHTSAAAPARRIRCRLRRKWALSAASMSAASSAVISKQLASASIRWSRCTLRCTGSALQPAGVARIDAFAAQTRRRQRQVVLRRDAERGGKPAFQGHARVSLQRAAREQRFQRGQEQASW